LQKNPSFIYKQYPDATDIVLNKKGANVEVLTSQFFSTYNDCQVFSMTPQQSAVIAFRIARDFQQNGKCRMTASNPISEVQAFSAALPKNSPFTKTFEKV